MYKQTISTQLLSFGYCNDAIIHYFTNPCLFFFRTTLAGEACIRAWITRKLNVTCMAPTCCRLSFEMEGWLPWELAIYENGDSLVGSVPCSVYVLLQYIGIHMYLYPQSTSYSLQSNDRVT